MRKKTLKNIIYLYGMSVSKIMFSLLTLPYLTRVLTTDSYGIVSYVKTIMSYMQLIVDFGFSYSATKDIVEATKIGKEDIEKVVGNTLLAKIILVIIAFIILFIISLFIPILKENILFTLLSFIPVASTILLFDFLFKGLEMMHVSTTRFVVTKTISTVFTIILIKNDSHILLIPILDIIGTIVAGLLVMWEMSKLKIKLRFTSLKESIIKLKESAVYFLSDFSTTAFGALNTVVIGMYLSKTEVAYWSLVTYMLSAVMSFYTPITGGIYPDMVAHKTFSLVKKLLRFFMPIIFLGCIFTLVVAKYALIIIGGQEYAAATSLLRAMTPLLALSFPVMLIGWPTLGAIGKAKEVTTSTIISAVFQATGLIFLVIIDKFSLLNIATVRLLSETVLLSVRTFFCYKNRYLFSDYKTKKSTA
ncbi:MAG: oligosaccharide flippase family protein [Erysipelotrichia bacterium]|nr:oligosaccharide flippase family protein [Erysipelotrichia bacterium]